MLEDSVPYVLRDGPDICAECVQMELMAVIGDTTGPGYIEEQISRLVIDGRGRFWLKQKYDMKVFERDGTFTRSIGRKGEGPGEFDDPWPVYRSEDGKVHVLDPGNLRETVFDSEFNVVEEIAWHGLPFFSYAVPLPGRTGYVINAWIATPEAIGLPLHIVRSGKIVRSLGQEVSGQEVQETAFTNMRIVAVDPAFRIFSMRRFDSTIEVWDSTGDRIATFAGPALNAHAVKPTFYSADNPLPTEVVSMHAEDDGILWIVMRRPRADWMKYFEERVYPDGLVGLELKDDVTLGDVYSVRVEVVDLLAQRVLARRDIPGFFSIMNQDFVLTENRWAQDGSPQVAVWQLSLVGPGR